MVALGHWTTLFRYREQLTVVVIAAADSVTANAGLAGHLDPIYNHDEPEKPGRLIVEWGVQCFRIAAVALSSRSGSIRLPSTVGC